MDEPHSDSPHTGPNKVAVAINSTLKSTQPQLNIQGSAPGFASEDTVNKETDLLFPGNHHHKLDAVVFETVSRPGCGTDAALLVSGVPLLTRIMLPAGYPVTAIGWESGATGYTPGTGSPVLQFGLADSSFSLLRAATAETTGVTWSADTMHWQSVTSFTTTYTGAYYLELLCVLGTGGVLPTLTAASTRGGLAFQSPILVGNSSTTGLTSLPSTISSLTQRTNVPYGGVA